MTFLETFISLGYYLSILALLGFIIATLLMGIAVNKFGHSAMGSIFSYICIGTGIFIVIGIFQQLGGQFFGISSDSMDIWWHIMFYMAFGFYFFGLKYLVNLGSEDQSKSVKIGSEKLWGGLTVVTLVAFFFIPKYVDGIIRIYSDSPLASFGLHHFIAFALAGLVGFYLISAKKSLGQIGSAIANPMIVAILAFSLQHLWELLNESWKVVHVTSQVGESGEKILWVIAAIALSYSSVKLMNFAKA